MPSSLMIKSTTRQPSTSEVNYLNLGSNEASVNLNFLSLKLGYKSEVLIK